MAAGDENREAAVERLTGIGTFEWRPSSQEILWSDQMFRIFGYEPGEVEPSLDLVLGHVHPADRQEFRRLIELQRGGPHARTLVFQSIRRDGQVRTMLGTIGAVVPQPGGTPTLIGTLQDVTERRLTEQHVAAHNAVAETLNGWRGLAAPLVSLLQRLGTSLDSVVGALWAPSPSSDALECIAFWSAPEVDATEFEAETRTFRAPERSIIERVWKTGAPMSIENVIGDEEFVRRGPAMRAGLEGWIALPVRHEEEVLAVLEFYSREKAFDGEALIETLTGIGFQLGQFFAWNRGELASRPRLTERECEVLQLAAQGMNAAESGRRLSVTPATIKSHFRNIFEKLGVSDRAAAVAEAMRLGLIR